jgi:hypothetical protein
LRPEERAVHGFELAEAAFTPERRLAIAQFLNITPEDSVLVPYLAACATYGLSPIMGEIWLIPQKVTVRDGDATRKVDRYRPAVGRDGYLSIARRDQRFRGLQGAVVCEHDTFEVEYAGGEDDPKVLHRFASKPTAFESGEQPDRYRGRIIGAWAKCLVSGQPAQFYFANMREHAKIEHEFDWGQNRGERIWHWVMPDGRVIGATQRPEGARPKMSPAGAWDYASAMILKAAQSYVLRIAMGITGLAPADEIVLDRGSLPEGGGVTDTQSVEFDWSRLEAPEELRERLQAAVDAANAVAPLSWSPAKIEMVLLGRPVEELEERAQAIEREVELHSSRIDPPPSAQAEAPEEEPVGQEEADVEPQEAVVTITAGEAERLRHELADIEAAMEELEPGTEEYAERASEAGQLEHRLQGAPPRAEADAPAAAE